MRLVCLLLAVACEPDQFVSMGFDARGDRARDAAGNASATGGVIGTGDEGGTAGASEIATAGKGGDCGGCVGGVGAGGAGEAGTQPIGDTSLAGAEGSGIRLPRRMP